MRGDGIMANFVSYQPLKPNVDPNSFPEFNNMDTLDYNFLTTKNSNNSTENKTVKSPVQEKINSQFKSETDPEAKSKIDRVVDYALSKAHKSSTRWCAKYVRQALESQGFTPGHSINGWEYEKAAKNMGWKEVTDGSIKRGDIIVTKKHDGRGHVALATKDNADIFNDRTSSVSDFVSRAVPYARDKVKDVRVYRYQIGGILPDFWVSYSPNKKLEEKPKNKFKLGLKELETPFPILGNTPYQQILVVNPEQPTYLDTKITNTPVSITRKYFNDRGYGISAYGFIGNFLQESGLNPAAVNEAEKRISDNYGAGIYQASNARKKDWERTHGKKFEEATLEEQLEQALLEANARPALRRTLTEIDQAYEQGKLSKEDAIERSVSAVLLGFENGSEHALLTPAKFDAIYLKNPRNRKSYLQHVKERTKLALDNFGK